MPRGNEDRRKYISRILSVHAMPRENFILEMHSSGPVDHNGVGAGGHVGHSWKVRPNSIAQRFFPAIVQQIHVICALCASRYLPERMDVQTHGLLPCSANELHDGAST